MRSGCVNGRPTDVADIIVLLRRGNLLSRIRRIVAAAADSALPRRKIGDQEEARAAELRATELTANPAEQSLLRRRIGLRVLP